ncbi:MAG TPA: D-2-hydroxyacid dehydrogenase [Saprospiraceae bacterium]|nr:D-2-hydroxyacid dehydrogenase [Saprospiraceae bacterium]
MSEIRLLANDGIDDIGKSMLEKEGFVIDTARILQEELPVKLPAYQGIIVRSATEVRKSLIDQCPGLKVIARGGVGLDNIDVEYAQSKGIAVINTPAASSESVAELVFAHILMIARFLHQSNRAMPVSGNTDFTKLKKAYSGGIELKGKTLGIIGFGRIGQALGRIARGFGMHIIAVDPYINVAELSGRTGDASGKVVLHTVPLDEVLHKSDVISLHVPGTGGPLISHAEIEQMKDGVILINAARGGAIDESALLGSLNTGKVFGAGLDVFENEPTPSSEILSHPRISLSPHIGGSTEQAQANIGIELANKIIELFRK